MNDEYYKDEQPFKFRPTHIKKQRKPPFVREFGYFSPYLLNRKLVPAEREGYYHYYYMESYFTPRAVKVGNKYVKVYDEHVSRKSVEVTLEQFQKLHSKDKDDFNTNRFEDQQLEFNIRIKDKQVNPFYAIMGNWDRFNHEPFWVNAFDLERVLNTLSDEDLDIFLYSREKHMKQKQIAAVMGLSEAHITRRMRFIEDKIEYDMLDDGERTETQIKAIMQYNRFIRTGKCESFADVFVYDFLLSMPQEMQLRYLYLMRGQQKLIKFCFLWVYEYFSAETKPVQNPKTALNKISYQLYKKHAAKLRIWSRQLFIALEIEVDNIVRRFGIRDNSPNEEFIKTVRKAAKARGLTVAEYRDNLLFPHGREKILARFKKYLKLHPEHAADYKPPIKPTNTATRNFVTRKSK